MPDECTIEETQTLSQRQRRLAAKVNGYGGINEAFYRRQLDALGYQSVSITQYQNEADNPRPDIATDDDYRYLWQVNIPTLATIDVMTCASSCVDSLRTWGDTVIECVINKVAPSHTEVVFAYTE
ncbi:putative phage tail protein [Cronobacter dublinensis]